jgi:hypothetical protein
MFKVRKEQMGAFREGARRDFEDAMLAHLRRCFPAALEPKTDDALRALVGVGIERATALGLSGQRDVCKLVDLMVVFGVDFERTEGWARAILDAGDTHPAALLEALLRRGRAQP